MGVDRAQANAQALKRMIAAEPVLVDVQPAGDVVPGMRRNLILASGPPSRWQDFSGVQRQAILNGLCYEGLAASAEEAAALLDAGEVEVGAPQVHGAVGASTGIITASMPVFVVENRAAGNRAFCNMVESNPPRLFANGSWGDDVRDRMRFVNGVIMPVIGEAARRAGGIPLKPIMRRAIGMGDEMHTRSDAATTLFITALVPHLLELEARDDVRRTVQFLQTTVMFLRLTLPSAKVALDAAHGVEGSSVVTGMVNSIKEFAIRVSGLGDEWFRGPHPDFLGDYFWGSGPDDACHAGGESWSTEAIGLGGFAQAAALSLPFRGTVEAAVERNRAMYDITVGENPELKIPYFDRGVPAGIDVFKVVDTGVRPFMNGVVFRKDGSGAAGLGPLAASIAPFQAAAEAWRRRYGG